MTRVCKSLSGSSGSVSIVGRKNADNEILIDELEGFAQLSGISWCVNSSGSVFVSDGTSETILSLSGNGSFPLKAIGNQMKFLDKLRFDISSLAAKDAFSIFLTLEKVNIDNKGIPYE